MRIIAVAALALVSAGSAVAAPSAPRILGPQSSYDARPTFTFSARGAVRFECAFDSTRLHRCARRYSERLEPGRHVLRARALDAAGHRSGVSTMTVQRKERTYLLKLRPSGAGALVVQPGGRRCTTNCSVRLAEGTVATVRAAPDTGYRVSTWAADCHGTATSCRLTMKNPRTVAAIFEPISYDLAVTLTGSGSVSASTGVIACPGTCTGSLAYGTDVSFLASPSPGWAFSGWTGCASTNIVCTLRVGGPTQLTATFVRSIYSLAISPSGNGAVLASGPPCNAACTLPQTAGQPVMLTALPGIGTAFAGWTGDCAGTSLTCVVQMDRDRTVGAVFQPLIFTLKVSATGEGRVKAAGTTLDCPGACSVNLPYGTTVTLQASQGAFGSWDGACNVLGPTCTLTITKDAIVFATFTPAGAPDLGVAVVDEGNGPGGHVVSNPAGINCPGACSGSFTDTVTLTPTPDVDNGGPDGWTFIHWGGYCIGSLPTSCALGMPGPKNVTALFRPNKWTLTLNVTGGPNVWSDDGRLDCTTTCSAMYGDGALVVLHAPTRPLSWTSCDVWVGTTCTIRMNADHTLNVDFLAPGAPNLNVTIVDEGNGPGGHVTSDPAGIDCPGVCSGSFPGDITLTATPDVDNGSADGWTFIHWGGYCLSTSPTCLLTIPGPKNATALFRPNKWTLTVNVGGGQSIGSDDGRLNCSTTCSTMYGDGASILLTAPSVAQWDGCDVSVGTQCSLTMNHDRAVNVTP